MENYLIEMFGVSLALTIAVELAAAYVLEWSDRARQAKVREDAGSLRFTLFGMGRGRGVLLVVLVNVLTNPPAVLLCWLGRLYMPDVLEMPVELAVELVVVAAEAFVYCRFAKNPPWRIDRPVRLAVAANVCSWLSGVIFLMIRRSL